jgi:hypothetical protein
MEVTIKRTVTIILDHDEANRLANFCHNALLYGYASGYDRVEIEKLRDALSATTR